MRMRWLAWILASGCALCAAQPAPPRVYFSLMSNETALPGGEAPVLVRAEGVSRLEFRLYRVRDARAFFLKLDRSDSLGRRPAGVSGRRSLLERLDGWKRRQRAKLRDFARMQFSPENRSRIRAWMQSGQPGQKAGPVSGAASYADVPLLNPDQLVKRWIQPVKPAQPWEGVTVRVPLEESGVYLLEATDGVRRAHTVLLATPLALLAKAARGRVALRLVDRRDGTPRNSCDVEALDVAADRSLARGQTDGGGSWGFDVREDLDGRLIVLAKCGADVAAASPPAWTIRPRWQDLAGAIHTDRPVYRPGQKVRLRAIVREDRDGEYALPQARRARIRVMDAEGTLVWQQAAPFTKYGTVSAEFDLPEDAPLGYFGVQVAPEGSESMVYGGFHVEEYRKPEYEVLVRPSAPRLLQGARAEVAIQARYYYGEPVAGAAVEWAVYRYSWYPPWWEWEEIAPEEEEEESFGGEQVLEQQGRLDAEGRLTVSFPVERGEQEYTYRVEARVTDEGGRAISGASSFLATRAPFLITARPENWVYAPGDTVRWLVSAMDFDRQPVAGVPVRVELVPSRDGKLAGAALLSRSAVTNAQGDAVIEFPAPGSGPWLVVTRASTARGDLAERGMLWVRGEWKYGRETASIRLVADKASYKPGETARVLVVTGVPRADVWLTVEGAGLYWSRQVRIEGGTGTVEIPVKAEYSPNVFVSAVFLLGNRMYQGSRILKVPPEEKQIFVELTPSKKQFQPGEPAAFRLSAKDHQGQPLRAEFALGVVDEAIYAIQREAQPDLVRIFYGQRWNRVELSSSQWFHFWGEAGQRPLELARRGTGPFRAQLKRLDAGEIRVRKEFPDTAFWIADLETDAQGRAEVRFAFPDSLTTWRATARGVTADTKVGGAVERVLVRKDILVSVAAPRFLREGDEVVVPVVARNYTGSPLRARLRLEAGGVRIVQGREAEVDIAPQGEARLDALLRAERAGRAKLTASVVGAGSSDAMEITLPVHAYGLPFSAAAQARLEGAASQTLAHEFPPEAGESSRMVELRLAPSLAGAVFGALEYLLQYPYGCTEQLVSSLLPNLAVAEALRTLKPDAQVDRRELARNVTAGLEKLYAHQNSDGAWGWWHEDSGGVFLTSYVLLALRHAEENGFAVQPARRSQAEEWLEERLLRDAKLDPDERAYAVMALTTGSRGDAKLRDLAWQQRDRMSGFGMAALGLAMQRARDPRRQEAAARLASLAKQEGEEVFWPGVRDPLFHREAEHSFEATAMAVRFLAAEAPDSPLLDGAVRWLMNRRDRGYYWGSTKRATTGDRPSARRSSSTG